MTIKLEHSVHAEIVNEDMVEVENNESRKAILSICLAHAAILGISLDEIKAVEHKVNSLSIDQLAKLQKNLFLAVEAIQVSEPLTSQISLDDTLLDDETSLIIERDPNEYFDSKVLTRILGDKVEKFTFTRSDIPAIATIISESAAI